jgi:hypothetical protein
LALVGLGLGLALAPVNAAALASAPQNAHGVVSSLVVLARVVGMVVEPAADGHRAAPLRRCGRRAA